MVRDRRALLEEALGRHGIAPAAVPQVRGIGQTLRDLTLRRRLEFAALVDCESGIQVGDLVEGEPDEVDASPLFRQVPPGRRVVALHTHPHNLPLSIRDVAVLVVQTALSAVIAIGRDGVWDIVSHDPDAPARRPNVSDLRTTFVQIAEATASQFQVPPYQSERVARRAHALEIWRRAAPQLGLRYDRVEGTARR